MMRLGALSFLPALVLWVASPSQAETQSAPVAQEAAVDPARLSLAAGIAGTVFPDGTYKRIMGETMSKLMDGMMKMPLRQMVASTGIDGEKVDALDESKVQEITAIMDPHFRDRTQRMMDTMFAAMGDFMAPYEPRLRNALARSFARKFDQEELMAIRDFFATPAGGRLAADYMTMFLEPEIMAEMQGVMPEMVKQMPALMEPAIKAAEKLPKPRTIKELSPAEQKKVASLLGVTPEELRKASATAEKEKTQ